MKLDCPT